MIGKLQPHFSVQAYRFSFIKALLCHCLLVILMIWGIPWFHPASPSVAAQTLTVIPDIPRVNATLVDEAELVKEDKLKLEKAQALAKKEAEKAKQVAKLQKEKEEKAREKKEAEKAEKAKKIEQAKLEKAKQYQEKLAKDEAKKQEIAKEKAEKALEEKKAKEQAEKEKALAEKKAKEAEKEKVLAEKKAKELQAEKEKAALKQQEDLEKKRRELAENQLQEALAAERSVSQNRDKLNQYKGLIIAKIKRNWRMPIGFTKGMRCTVVIEVTPAGEVLGVEITKTSGNAEFDRSTEVAIYKSSPLPLPEEPDLRREFRTMELIFKPEAT